MRMAVCALALALALVACGSSPAPPVPVAPIGSNAKAADVPSGRFVRVALIDETPFESQVKTDLSTAKKWGADPANAMNVRPTFLHILVKAGKGDAAARAAARRKADDLLARLERGENFATLAKSSDDPGSANNGGAYAGRMVKQFVPEMREAYAELRPGEHAKKPVETQFGWHVVAKGPIDDEACLEGHRAWLARNEVERIGHDLAKRLRHLDGSASGERLPAIVRMSAETCDGFATIARGEGISWRNDTLVVAALTNDEPGAGEVDAEGCDLPAK